jgi:SAM-dependent methyltransferase
LRAIRLACYLKSNPPNPPIEICEYENSNWRTAFWPGREYEDRAERIALSHMLPPRDARLCEIGAGFGRLAEFYLGYQRIILIDYARSMLTDARERLMKDSRFTPHASRFLFVAADLYDLPLADSALDTVVTVRVLHHIADIPRAFGEIARVVRPEGTYLTEFANKRHLKAVLRYALTRREPNPFTLEPYEFVKLNFDFHPRYIDDELRQNHFVIGDRRAVSTFRVALLKRIVPANILAGIDGLLQHPTSSFQLSPSIFVRAQSTKPGAPALTAALWRCPACKSTEIGESAVALSCRACARVYPIIDGIIDFKSQM